MKAGTSGAEKLVSALLVGFLLSAGWFILLDGGVAIAGRSGRVSYVDGRWALGLAGCTFLFAAMSSLLVARAFSLGRQTAAWLALLVILHPVAYLLVAMAR